MEESKTSRSIRADAETLDKFKALSESFESQGDCLKSLISAYEINNAKHILTGVSTDIADYESHINSIQSAFLHILELNNNAEQRIRQEFEQLLESKDKTIAELQSKSEQLKAEKEKAVADKKEDAEQIQQLESQLSDAEQRKNDAIKSADDKQRYIDNLLLQVSEIETIKADASRKDNEIQSLKADVSSKETEISNLTSKMNSDISEKDTTIDKLKRDIEYNEQSHKQALDMAEQIKNTAVASAIAETKSTYMDKLFKLQEDNSNLKDQVRKLERLLEKAAKVETDDNSGTDAEETPEEQLENQLTFD